MEHLVLEDSPVPRPYGAYSHAVVAGGFAFISGQIARDADTGLLIDGDIAAQTIRCLEIVRDILHELGLTMTDIVRVTVYLANIDDFAAMNAVYEAAMPPPYPARSTPEVKLPFGARIGIEVTALCRHTQPIRK